MEEVGCVGRLDNSRQEKDPLYCFWQWQQACIWFHAQTADSSVLYQHKWLSAGLGTTFPWNRRVRKETVYIQVSVSQLWKHWDSAADVTTAALKHTKKLNFYCHCKCPRETSPLSLWPSDKSLTRTSGTSDAASAGFTLIGWYPETPWQL